MALTLSNLNFGTLLNLDFGTILNLNFRTLLNYKVTLHTQDSHSKDYPHTKMFLNTFQNTSIFIPPSKNEK